MLILATLTSVLKMRRYLVKPLQVRGLQLVVALMWDSQNQTLGRNSDAQSPQVPLSQTKLWAEHFEEI